MSEILGPDMKRAVRKEYVRREALSRLSQWPMANTKFANAFEYLTERGCVKEIVDEAELPLTQVLLNAPEIDRIDPAVVDNIISRVVHEKSLGVLGVDSLGNRLFRPWTKAKTV